NIKRFLFSFFFYSAGVQTVIYLASTFASDELKFEAFELIATIFILQLVAIVGAILFAKISDKYGNKGALISMLIIWSLICVVAYFVTDKFEFYIIAASVGLVMGGIQSVSRSSYSKLIPEGTEDTASYFSFYDVLEKVAIVLGTFSFGFIEQVSGGMRNSILVLIIYFIIGIGLLLTVNFKSSSAVTKKIKAN
ncbi:MAG: MFS transporter, partial [Bacteroidota bacterium]